MNYKFDFDDILIEPSELSYIDSRKQVNLYDNNGMLPLFTAPMDTVVDINNVEMFKNNLIYPILPRTVETDVFKSYIYTTDDKYWTAVGLKEFEDIFLESEFSFNKKYILIDIANGHMKKLLDDVELAKKKYGDKLILMVGNIANPDTYVYLSNAGADYCRAGVGNGGGCLTSQNVGVGYPLASLITECYEKSLTLKNPAKIVADGGMKNYSDVIKALAIGADYVMLGSILNRSLESAGETLTANIKHQGKEIYTEPGEPVDQYSEGIRIAFKHGSTFYKKFRGMSTKVVQKKLGNIEIKTSEGVNRMQKVEYTLDGWIDNFKHYLSSAMSYTGSSNLEDFIGKCNFNLITQNSFNRFNK